MGSFTELVLEFDFRPDAPEHVMAAFASAKQGEIGPDLPPPVDCDEDEIFEFDEVLDSGGDPSTLDWGAVLALEMRNAYLETSGPIGCSLTWSPTRNLWHLASRGVFKSYPDELLGWLQWMAPYACPQASSAEPVEAGRIRFDVLPDIIPLFHDGTRFSAPGLRGLDY